MSRHDARRPNRIVPPSQTAPIPTARIDAISRVSSVSVERFRLALRDIQSSRGPEKDAWSPEAGPRAADRDPETTSGASREPLASFQPLPSSADARRPQAVSGTAAIPRDGLWPDFIAYAAAPQEAGHPNAGEGEAVPEASFAEHMAATILALIRSYDGDAPTFTVTLSLHPAPMPETEVTVSLSPHWLSVRFATQVPESSRRLWGERDKLRSLLRACLNDGRDIDIDIL